MPARADREPLRPESVTHVSGINRHPCDRNGPTLDEHISRAGWIITLLATLLGGLGVVAGLLGVVGVQSVLAFAVAQRHKEIAIRLALGSSTSNMIRRILGRSALEGAAGALLGLAIAGAAATAVGPLLFGLGTFDMWTGILLAITTLAAVFAAQAIRVFRMGMSSQVSVLRET